MTYDKSCKSYRSYDVMCQHCHYKYDSFFCIKIFGVKKMYFFHFLTANFISCVILDKIDVDKPAIRQISTSILIIVLQLMKFAVIATYIDVKNVATVLMIA